MSTITNKTAPKGQDEQLEKQIRKDLCFLFTDFGATVVTNRYLPGIGNSELIIEAKSLRFKAVQYFGQIHVSIAPVHNSEDWKDLTSALMAVRTEVRFKSRQQFESLAEQGQWLRQDFGRLEEAFSISKYPETLLKMKASWRVGSVTWSFPSVCRPMFKMRCIGFFVPMIFGPFKLIARIYQLLFPRDKNRSYPIGSDQTFVNEVREEVSFLFTEHSARITSSGYFRSFGNACVAIDAGNLRLRAVRDRSVVSYNFAPIVAPWFWNSLERGVMAMQMEDRVIPSPPFTWGIRRLSEYFVGLSDVCSAEKFPETKRKLEIIREASRKEFFDRLEQQRQSLQSQNVNITSRRV